MANNAKPKPVAPIKADRKPQPPRRYAYEKPANAAETVRESARNSLKRLFDEFQRDAWPEERALLVGALENWSNTGGGMRRNPGTFAPPFFEAVAEAIDCLSPYLVCVPREEMVTPVEDFIDRLVKEGTPPAETPHPSEITKRRMDDIKYLLNNEFWPKVSSDDLYLLEGILYRWKEYMAEDKSERPESPLKSAAQMEIYRFAYVDEEESAVMIRMFKRGDWLGALLGWIAQKGAENLSPCLVAARAASLQEAFDKGQAA